MGVLSTLLVPMGPYYEELMELGGLALCGIGFIAFIVLSVILNILQQLLFKDPTKPPLVFHYFPFFGSTVVYGMDPYKFFSDCQEKVSFLGFTCQLGYEANVCVVRRYLYLCHVGKENDGNVGS